MRKMSLRLTALVVPLLVSSVSFAGQQIGDNTTLSVPAGTITKAAQVIVVIPTVKSQVAIVVPGVTGFKEFKVDLPISSRSNSCSEHG